MAATPPRVLIVDDMEDNLVALEAILRPLHVALVRARSGEDAMKALLRDEFAMVLLDVVMPGMDGFETATHIKRLDQTKDIPIIFLTAEDSAPAYAFRGYAAGAVDYLTKPFDPWVLRAKVEVFIDLYRKNQQLREQSDALRTLVPCAPADAPLRGADFLGRLSAIEEALTRLTDALPAASAAKVAPQLARLTGQVGELRTTVEALARVPC